MKSGQPSIMTRSSEQGKKRTKNYLKRRKHHDEKEKCRQKKRRRYDEKAWWWNGAENEFRRNDGLTKKSHGNGEKVIYGYLGNN